MNNAVLFVVGKSYISRRIQAYTRQDGISEHETASHVAYKFWRNNQFWVVESHFHSNVVSMPFTKWLDLNKENKWFEVVDNSYNLDLMLSKRGEKYGTKDVLKIKLETDLAFINKKPLLRIFGYPLVLGFKALENIIFTENNEGIYCSELLLLANDTISREIGKKPFESFPSDLQKYYLDKRLIK